MFIAQNVMSWLNGAQGELMKKERYPDYIMLTQQLRKSSFHAGSSITERARMNFHAPYLK